MNHYLFRVFMNKLKVSFSLQMLGCMVLILVMALPAYSYAQQAASDAEAAAQQAASDAEAAAQQAASDAK